MPSEDKLTQAQFSDMMRNGLTQAKAGRCQDLSSAFAKINEQI